MAELSVIVPTRFPMEEIDCLRYLPPPDSSPVDYETIVPSTQGLGRARNQGIRKASADKIVFLDDDSHPCDGYLLLAAALLDEHSIVAGRVIDPGDDMFTRISRKRGYDPDRDAGPGGKLIGCNMAMRREVFDVVGGFYEGIRWGHEETIFQYAAEREFDVYYEPDLVVEHRLADSAWDFWKKEYGFGRADVHLAQETNQPIFSPWQELIPIGSGQTAREVIVKTVGNIVRITGRLREVVTEKSPDLIH